jgi:hypothetical protein
MSNARYCVQCGKKFYPKSYSAQPQGRYLWNGDNWEHEDIDPSYKRFHSQGCMKDWITVNAQSFANLIDSISHNVIEEDNHNIERINNYG